MVSEKSVAGASYAGGIASVLSALTLTEWGVIIGILTALATFGFNIWFRWRQDKREQLEHRLRIGGLLDERRHRNEGHKPERRHRE